MHRRTHGLAEVAEPRLLGRRLARMGGGGGRLGDGIADASPGVPMPDAGARPPAPSIRVASAPPGVGAALSTVVPALAPVAAAIPPASTTPTTFGVRDPHGPGPDRHRQVGQPRDRGDRQDDNHNPPGHRPWSFMAQASFSRAGAFTK